MGRESRITAAVIDGRALTLQVINRGTAPHADPLASAAAAALALTPAMVEIEKALESIRRQCRRIVNAVEGANSLLREATK